MKGILKECHPPAGPSLVPARRSFLQALIQSTCPVERGEASQRKWPLKDEQRLPCDGRGGEGKRVWGREGATGGWAGMGERLGPEHGARRREGAGPGRRDPEFELGPVSILERHSVLTMTWIGKDFFYTRDCNGLLIPHDNLVGTLSFTPFYR